MKSEPRRLPAAVERLALERAARIAETCEGVLSFGIGFKHSRKSEYGRRPRYCLKFVVAAKKRERRARQRGDGLVPRQIKVTHRGTIWRIPTDVIAVGGASEQSRIAIQSQPEVSGVASFAVGESGGGEVLLLTAGHVLRTQAGVPQGAPVTIDGVPGAGRVEARLTLPADASGLLDIGCVACPANSHALAFLGAEPWSRITGIVDSEALTAIRRRQLQPMCSVIGAAGVQTVALDAIMVTSLSVPFPSGPVHYRPGMVLYRAVDGEFQRGDSGSVVVLGRRALAVHAVGFRDDRRLGYGASAAAVMEFLHHATGRPLQLLARPME
jgi:hypothetical protein